jgi:hypothetical protein
MEIISSFLVIIFSALCASGKEKIYIGSTPAHSVVRYFLGIPISDSIDFIKWKLAIQDEKYVLQCRFGIGKPNTDDFINGGTKIELTGELRKEKNYYYLRNGNKTLKTLELNANLLYLLNEDNSLLVGNGGWSYTLNIDKPSGTNQVNIFSKKILLKDSMTFQGRTPCHDFPEIHPSPNCIKKKWLVVLYADSKTNQPTTYNLNGNSRGEGGIRGSWKIITSKDGRIIYQLYSDKENASVYLLKLDENILVFTDEQGKLLVGDKDFSFTLNRRW